MAPLSPACWQRVRDLFPPELHAQVATLLEKECGNNLPFLENADSEALDRYRFAALELSDGDLKRLREAVDLAKQDWRDLLVAASRRDKRRR